MKKLLILIFFLVSSVLIYWVVDRFVVNPKLDKNKLDFVTGNVDFKSLKAFQLPEFKSLMPFDSQKLAAQLTIVHFWASWCGPCQSEFPSLIAMAKKHPMDLTVVAISLDQERTDIEYFLQKQQTLPNNLIVLWDMANEVSKNYGSHKLPESYIFNKNRMLIKKIAGTKDWSKPISEREIVQWLSEEL